MTYIVPVTAAAAGYGAMATTGHPTAAFFVAGGCAFAGFLGRFAGHGLHISRSQMRKVEYLLHRTLAADWGIRPITRHYDENQQQKLVGSMFDAVAGEAMQNLVEQWPVIWGHIQRVHFSGIPPLASLKAMKRAYRPGLFGKDKARAREIAKPVVEAYAMLHPDPESDRDWYMRWCTAIGLPETVAHQMWADAMRTIQPVRQDPAARKVAEIAEELDDDSVILMAAMRAAQGDPPERPAPPARAPAAPPSSRHLSDDEIARRMAASR